MQITIRSSLLALAALSLMMLPARALVAQQATTTGTVRGTVYGPNEVGVAGAAVVAINSATGTRRGTLTDDRGRYNIPFLDPGTYTVRAQRIGFRPSERTGMRATLGRVETQDFRLEPAATQLDAVNVTASTTQLIEPTKTGTSTRILEEQLRQLPTSDRNFKNLVVLTPGSSDIGATGAGGGQSLGGGRTASSNILMDGVNNNESFFGGDARGGDRLPFSYSIEAVKEIQVITAGYDVERGQFTGGTVNAVTKSGTNTFTGSIFDYERGDKRFGLRLTGNDFLGRAPRNYMRQQYGASVGGPILKDKLHFFFALDRQVGNEPRPVLQTALDAATMRAAGIHPDTLVKLQNIARTTYGYDLAQEVGAFKQNIDESAVFGRIDWQINDRHTLTVRDNYLNFQQTNDRLTISPSLNETTSNAGPYKAKANSAVVALTSVLSPRFSNELRAQLSNDRKPRPSNPSVLGGIIPQVRINGIAANPGDGGANVSTAVIFGSDPVLHANNLEQDTYELIDNLRYTRENHTFKVGTSLSKIHVFNDFFFNGLGSFTYNSLADFQNRIPASFTRALPYTPTSGNPIALFDVYETAVYAQDEWQVTPKLFLTYGLRYDVSRFPTTPAENPLLTGDALLGVRNDVQPTDRNNIAPRFGFTYDPSADGKQVIRGGTGLFYGRAPYVLYGNSLGNTGRTQLDLNCQGALTPQPDFAAYAQNASSIPTTCVGGGAAAASKASPVLFASDFEMTQAWKTNLAYDRLIAPNWRLTLEGVFTRTTNDYIVRDINLDATQDFAIEGGIPVYQPVGSIATTGSSAGRTNIAFSRRSTNFNNVFVQSSAGEAKSLQGIVQVQGATRWGGLLASYTYDRTKDFSSSSCCIAGGDLFNSLRTNGNPNDLSDQYAWASYSRPHSVIISPTLNLPYGVLLSGIYRGFSGLPWTPTYGSDVNADGVANDRLYIPTDADFTSPAGITFFHNPAQGLDSASQRAQYLSAVRSNECLASVRGQVVSRNSCRNPWQNVLDARVAKRFETVRGQGMELSVDFFNVLNGLKSSWGQRNEVQATNMGALTTRGFNATTQRYLYQYNANFGKAEPSAYALSQQFQVQLGARYSF
jgi:hypothetical protein